MPSPPFYIGLALVIIIAAFVLRRFFGRSAAYSMSVSGFRLYQGSAEPAICIDLRLQMTDFMRFRTKRGELEGFLTQLVERPACAGTYDDLVHVIATSMDEYRALPASHHQADIALAALLLRQRIENKLKEALDPELAPYGVSIYGITNCAIGTRPP